ncbi:hypothetical protein TNCV_2257071 [Trichonephila clavipes]|nr:hypothetical protein TNCV_2257071 [Trichonephila clavipes]
MGDEENGIGVGQNQMGNAENGIAVGEDENAASKNAAGWENLFQVVNESAFKSYFNNEQGESFTQLPQTIHITRSLNPRIILSWFLMNSLKQCSIMFKVFSHHTFQAGK